MISRLSQNLGIKLLSLILSFALFRYVHTQQSSELTFSVPVTLRIDPSTRPVDQNLVRKTVSVTLSGPPDLLKRAQGQTKAIVELRGRGSGTYLPSVDVTIPPELHDQVVLVSWQPHVLSVQLEEQTSRRLPIQAIISVQPPMGLSLGRMRESPSTALISGWESDLRRVKRMEAVINSLGSSSTPLIDLVVPVRAMDEQGIEVGEGIQVQPPTIKVQGALERSIWFKPVYISPLLGEVPPSVRIQHVSVTPRRLTLRGPENAVGAVQFLDTEPITLPDAPGVVDREVRVILPPGVKTTERPRARVVIALQGG